MNTPKSAIFLTLLIFSISSGKIAAAKLSCDEILALFSPRSDNDKLLALKHSQDVDRIFKVSPEMTILEDQIFEQYEKWASAFGGENLQPFLELIVRAITRNGYRARQDFDIVTNFPYVEIQTLTGTSDSSLKKLVELEKEKGHRVIFHPEIFRVGASAAFLLHLKSIAVPIGAIVMNRIGPVVTHERDHSDVYAGHESGDIGLLSGDFIWNVKTPVGLLFPNFSRTYYSKQQYLAIHELAAFATTFHEAVKELATFPFSSDEIRMTHFRDNLLQYVFQGRYLAKGLREIFSYFRQRLSTHQISMSIGRRISFPNPEVMWIVFADFANQNYLSLPFPRTRKTLETEYPRESNVTEAEVLKLFEDTESLIVKLDEQYHRVLRLFLPKIEGADRIYLTEERRLEITAQHLHSLVHERMHILKDEVEKLYQLSRLGMPKN